MFAVIATGGKQYIVKQGDVVTVEKLPGDVGSDVVFDRVLLRSEEDGGDVAIGTPTVSGAVVKGTIKEQGRAKKIRVVKFKRKVRYKRVIGHRQDVTKVMIGAV